MICYACDLDFMDGKEVVYIDEQSIEHTGIFHINELKHKSLWESGRYELLHSDGTILTIKLSDLDNIYTI